MSSGFALVADRPHLLTGVCKGSHCRGEYWSLVRGNAVDDLLQVAAALPGDLLPRLATDRREFESRHPTVLTRHTPLDQPGCFESVDHPHCGRGGDIKCLREIGEVARTV